jgi:hypothetical protein
VAFAARCAERVRPLFERLWPNAPQDQTQALDRAIEAAARAARTGGREESWADYDDRFAADHEARKAAECADSKGAPRAAYIAYAASAAARAASDTPEVASAMAAHAASLAASVPERAEDRTAIIEAMRADLNALHDKFPDAKDDERTTIDPADLGPLEPAEAPSLASRS